MAAKSTKSEYKFLQNKRLSITRETELLQSFVRTNITDDEDDSQSCDADKKEKDTKTEQQEQIPTESDQKEAAALLPEDKKAEISNTNDNATEEVKKKLKKRRRRDKNRREELYCDKDRAAAVNMGSKDIKQSLKLKRKQDRSKALQIPEEAEPGTFLALGNYEMCRGDLQIALDFITKALELNPTEKSALVARSKCYILLGRPQNALEDAETALSIDKTFLKAIYQKAEALYYLGDFEHSLMYFHRGLHARPDNEEFKLGVHKAQKAIENAIGSPFVFARYLNRSNQESIKSSSVNNNKNNKSESGNSSSNSRSSRVKSRPKSRLLRELGPDKEYLDNLMKNPNLTCKFKENDSSIIKTVEETVEYLNARQEFWRQQLPARFK